jgi:cellulose synthase/poly-beta-1,6-N-acetylglucosamine synthase-like glycosyltransferase
VAHSLPLRAGHRSYLTSVIGLPRNAELRRPHDAALRPIAVTEEGLTLTRRLAERLGVTTGDPVIVEVMEGRRWSGHLVEDAEFQLELLLDGRLVRYEPDARLWAEMPEQLDTATSQNARWERGRLDLARRFTPSLLRELAARRDRRAVGDAILDLLTPPLSVLVAAQSTLLCVECTTAQACGQ